MGCAVMIEKTSLDAPADIPDPNPHAAIFPVARHRLCPLCKPFFAEGYRGDALAAKQRESGVDLPHSLSEIDSRPI